MFLDWTTICTSLILSDVWTEKWFQFGVGGFHSAVCKTCSEPCLMAVEPANTPQAVSDFLWTLSSCFRAFFFLFFFFFNTQRNTEYAAFLARKSSYKKKKTQKTFIASADSSQSSSTKLSSPTFKILVEAYFTPWWPAMTASRSPHGSNISNCVFVPCAQRVVQVCATTTEDALWKPADGTASASQAGEGPGVT